MLKSVLNHMFCSLSNKKKCLNYKKRCLRSKSPACIRHQSRVVVRNISFSSLWGTSSSGLNNNAYGGDVPRSGTSCQIFCRGLLDFVESSKIFLSRQLKYVHRCREWTNSAVETSKTRNSTSLCCTFHVYIWNVGLFFRGGGRTVANMHNENILDKNGCGEGFINKKRKRRRE